MIIGGRRASLLLFIGDIVAFAVSLYLTLWLRYGTLPDTAVLSPYSLPFALLFALWVLVFYSSGLYGKRLALFPSRLPDALFRTQLANILFAAVFFFLIPSFGIAPKTILALYLVVSLALIFVWRLVCYPSVSARRSREQAALLARGVEADELFNEVNGNPRYSIVFCSRDEHDACATILVVDASSAPSGFAGKGRQVVSFDALYEEVFDRVPLSRLEQAWFRDNVATGSFGYSFLKRSIDLAGGFVMGLITLVVTPFVALALQLEYPGPVFLVQTRIGQYGTRIRTYKFRSMRFGDKGAWKGEGENAITRVGSFLRMTSLDEFPQFVNVLKGELSLVGPRNDIEALGLRLADAIPYYLFRYSVRPGITGWAQINQQYEQGNVSPQSIEETKVRLAYDFYYLKHRSLGLDIMIALRTLKRMFFRPSSF